MSETRPAVKRALVRAERTAAVTVIRSLRRRIGWWRALRVLLGLAWDKLRGRPFGHLGSPRDERDRLSRRQCGDVILLDRRIRSLADASSAMGVARDAVLEGGVVFLDAMLPKADVDTLKQMGPQLADGFFNAEGVTALEGEEFRFTVRRCRFVELLDAANAAHLKPLFCEVDNAYFERDQSLITLRRDRTLAAGDAACEFRFRASFAGEARPTDSK